MRNVFQGLAEAQGHEVTNAEPAFVFSLVDHDEMRDSENHASNRAGPNCRHGRSRRS